MSQEFQKDQQINDQNDNLQRPKRNYHVIYLTIIAVLAGLTIYLLFSKNTVTQQRDMAYSQLDTVSLDRDHIRDEYDAALARLDMLVSKNTQLDSMVNNRESEIVRLKGQIQNILSNSQATAADYARARTLIGQLNAKVRSYEEQIAELEGENTRLSAYNETLAKERDSAVTTNIALAQKVRLGAVLHASNIRLVPIDLRRNGRKEKTTEKAGRVDVLRVTFDIDENRITEDGLKDIYLRIIGPKGNLLSNAAYGSGATITAKGETLNYTMAKQIDLKQGEPVKNIVVDWHQNSDYERGTYSIELYNEGFKIGSGSINLR